MPIADLNELTIGIHLLPEYVASRRVAVARLDPESDRLIDVAGSLRAHVYRALLELEADGENIERDVRLANAALGEGFYQPGRHGTFSAEDPERVMIDRFGGSPADYEGLAWFAQTRQSADEQLDWLRRGSEAFPECMYLHAKLAQLHWQRGAGDAASRSLARSLACHHHTAFKLDLRDYHAWGRRLPESHRSSFSEIARNDLMLESGEARLEWLVSLFQGGRTQTEISLKLLSDFRYDCRADLHPLLLQLLRRHYERLGWQWAMTWCDWSAADRAPEELSYLGQPLGSGWDVPLRKALGLA